MKDKGTLSFIASLIKVNGWEGKMSPIVDMVSALSPAVNKFYGEVTNEEILNAPEGAKLKILAYLSSIESDKEKLKFYKSEYEKTLREAKNSLMLGRLISWARFALVKDLPLIIGLDKNLP